MHISLIFLLKKGPAENPQTLDFTGQKSIISFLTLFYGGPSGIRTPDQPVMSRLL
jgi:hypothetical protein